MPDATQRFSTRVADYAQYRPTYPSALFDEMGPAWGPDTAVADIGAGTGIFSRLLAARGGRVYAVEPNGPMRTQGAAQSVGYPGLTWLDATAESTGLPDASLDALACAQAFHWVDAGRAAVEWRRILKPGAPVLLVWNERESGSPLQDAYETLLLRWSPDYARVNHRNVTPEAIGAFFAPYPVVRTLHRNDQRFDLEGWKGRLRSASYCPPPGQPGHAELMAGLEALFARYSEAGQLTFPYVTTAYGGRLH